MIVLYVSHDNRNPDEFCPGSLVCISLVQQLDDNAVTIQNCDVLRAQGQEFPAWLNGTPILIDQDEGVPHRGSSAVQKLREMTQRLAPPETRRRTSFKAPDGSPSFGKQTTLREEGEHRRKKSENTEGVPIAAMQTHFMRIGDEEEDENDEFHVETQSTVMLRDDKVTEADLQAYKQARDSSPASAGASQTQQQE